MSNGLQLLKLSGTFVTTHGGKQTVHGVATVMKSGVTLGVMFDEQGMVSTLEASPVPMNMDRGVALVCATVGGDQKSLYALSSLHPQAVIADGTHQGCHLADNPPMPELQNGAYHLTVMLKHSLQAVKASFAKPNMELELATVPWQEAYRELTETERGVADVVVWFAMYDDILGPDAPRQPLNFYSAATFRAVRVRGGYSELAPWALLAAEPVGG